MQKSLTLQPSQPLPGILEFGQAGVGIFLFELNLTYHLFAIYHPQPRDEAKLEPGMLLKSAQQKRGFLIFRGSAVPSDRSPNV